MSGDVHLTNKLKRLFLEALNLEVPSADTDLIEASLMDSLALVKLLLPLGQEFHVRFSVDDLEIDSFRTLRSIEQHVAAKR